ncbi:MAG: hypothetical protein K1X74_03635 [Pirellulales bacterium]|nr:hypothetical protein [Pirellulales bacterium]
MSLDREEYIEQQYFFRALGERMRQQVSTQELLVSIKDEILSTTRLPLALDFLAAELKLHGVMAAAMARLGHYFTAFQTYLVAEAENERGRFDFGTALEILHQEAGYRAAGATPQGIFLYEFEVLSRNRLRYDHGLDAIAADPIFDDDWRVWIQTVRRQVGIIDFADLLYVRSTYYRRQRAQRGVETAEPEAPTLFAEKEGKIAWANRRKDPMFLFAALQRQLGYPEVPRPRPVESEQSLLPQLARRLERVEHRLKLLEDEGKGGIDLTKFFGPGLEPPAGS